MGVFGMTTGRVPVCPTCGTQMRKGKKSSGAVVGTVLGLVLVAGGVAVFIIFPCVGWVIGPLLALLGWFQLGGKVSKVWRCKACKTYLPRG